MRLRGKVHSYDGYEPGAWDEVRRACMDGHITDAAYEVLFNAIATIEEDE